MRRGAGLPTPNRKLHGIRKARYFEGWAYPEVGTGEQVKVFTVELSAENIRNRAHYDDPANRLHQNDIVGQDRRLSGIINKPVMIEHGKDPRYGDGIYGKVETARMEADNRIFVTGWLYGADENGVENERAMSAIGELDSGHLGSLSLRWRTMLDEPTNTVLAKDVLELSLCHKPHYEGCVITTACSTPPSTGTGYDNLDGKRRVKTVERYLNLTMSATQEQTNQQAASPETTTTQQQQTQAAHPQGGASRDPHDVIQELTRRLEAENAARRKAQEEATELAKWREERERAEKAKIDAQMQEAIKPVPDVLATLKKHGLDEAQQVSEDTAEMLAKVFAEKVLNPNQQLGELVMACSAKLEEYSAENAKLTAQIKRTGNASSVAQLTMAASAAEDVMDLVSDKQGRGRTGEGVEDPLLEQHHKGMFSSQMPRSFFGGGWAMPQAQQQAGVPSLQDRLMARRLGHTVEPAFQQPAQPRAVESAASATETTQMTQTTTTHHQLGRDSADMLRRAYAMKPTVASDLIKVSTFHFQEGEDFPQERGTVFH